MLYFFYKVRVSKVTQHTSAQISVNIQGVPKVTDQTKTSSFPIQITIYVIIRLYNVNDQVK